MILQYSNFVHVIFFYLLKPRAEERIARAATKTKSKLALQKQQQSEEPQKKVKARSAATSEANENTARLTEEENKYFESVIEVSGVRGGVDASADGNGNGSQLLFSQLSLNRSLLRAVERSGYTAATPIQAQTIPHALAGKDICASAETGSGKTAGKGTFKNRVFKESV
jgi:hypothetical protein